MLNLASVGACTDGRAKSTLTVADVDIAAASVHKPKERLGCHGQSIRPSVASTTSSDFGHRATATQHTPFKRRSMLTVSLVNQEQNPWHLGHACGCTASPNTTDSMWPCMCGRLTLAKINRRDWNSSSQVAGVALHFVLIKQHVVQAMYLRRLSTAQISDTLKSTGQAGLDILVNHNEERRSVSRYTDSAYSTCNHHMKSAKWKLDRAPHEQSLPRCACAKQEVHTHSLPEAVATVPAQPPVVSLRGAGPLLERGTDRVTVPIPSRGPAPRSIAARYRPCCMSYIHPGAVKALMLNVSYSFTVLASSHR